MKVGILNFHYSKHNYGAVLQAAALADVIKKKSICVEHINYIPKPTYSSKVNRLKEMVLSSFSKLHLIKLIYKKPLASNHYIFNDFRRKWINVSPITYSSKEELHKEEFDYSHIIVGSDQVWRTSYTVDNAFVYFLDFSNCKTKKISYAASFGVDEWESANITKDVEKLLKKFDYISVREKSGINICQDTFNVNASHVLDPTLLAGSSFFYGIINAEKNNYRTKDNIVYYKLDVDKNFKDQIIEISEFFNCGYEDLYYKPFFYGYKYNKVDEWLSKIIGSKLVITDSFHCVCLSILFNKDFVCISNRVRGNSRLDSLFAQLGIKGRVYDEDSSISLFDFVSNLEKLNYKEINKKLEYLRIDSMKFLFKSLDCSFE